MNASPNSDRVPDAQIASRAAKSTGTPEPIRVVIIIGSLDVGGVEMDLLRNLPRLNRKYYSVSVYAFRYPGVLAAKMTAAGIPVDSPPAAQQPRILMTEAKSTAIPLHSRVARLQSAVRKRLGTFMARARDAVKRRLRKHGVQEGGRGVFILRLLRMSIEGAAMLLATLARATARLTLTVYWALMGVVARANGFVAQARAYAAVAVPMARYIRSQRAEVIHCFLPDAYFYGTLAALLAGKRSVVMSRVGLNVYQEKYPFYRVIERRFLHRFVRVAVGNAKLVLTQLQEEGVKPKKLFLLYNGIDVKSLEAERASREVARRALDIPLAAFVITVVANFHPYKGHEDLIEALAAIGEKLPAPWLVLAAGSDRAGHLEAMKDLAKRRGLESNVCFLGARDDVPRLLAAADLHVLPSHQEALPNSIIEAMATGLPVIATRVGGIPELIPDGASGLLVEPHDPAALSAAIYALANDPDRRQKMGELNRTVVRERFTLEKSVARYEELYSWVGQAGRAGRLGLARTR